MQQGKGLRALCTSNETPLKLTSCTNLHYLKKGQIEEGLHI